jgi:hypothetical protein
MIRREAESIKELMNARFDAFEQVRTEQFANLATKMDTIEAHRLELKADTARAIDTALAVQKEANAKADAAFTLQLDAMLRAYTVGHRGLEKVVDELRDRINTLQYSDLGERTALAGLQHKKMDSGQVMAWWVAGVVGVFSIINTIVLLWHFIPGR